ncbi:MAG: molybdopterin-binding protein [Candidatus Bathyarchaeia archaeon]
MDCSVELICIGNELLIGKILNKNAQWLSKEITKIGGIITRETTMGDNIDEIALAIKEALKRKPKFILTSGGLGSTPDDLTLKGVAKALKKPLKLNKTAFLFLKKSYSRLNNEEKIKLNKAKLKMAILPEGSTPLYNPMGTAPGVLIKYRGTTLICLPGVPKELKAIFKKEILKLILEETHGKKFFEESIMIRGVFESEISYLINKFKHKYPEIYLKSHPKGGKKIGESLLELHFSTFSQNENDCKEKILTAITNFIKMLINKKDRSRTRVKNH